MFSEYFNLVVYGLADESVFQEATGHASFLRDRLFEYTDTDIKERFRGDVSSLGALPTVFAAETRHKAATRTPARLSAITNVTEHSGAVHFDFRHLARWQFTSEEVFATGLFEADVPGENTRMHWAVKRGEAFQRVFKMLDGRAPKDDKPSLFDVEPWPLPQLEHVAVMMPF